MSVNQLIYLLSYVCVHVAEWLFECTVQKLVLVITCLETNKVLERWQFDIECDKSAKERRSAPLNIHIEALESLRGSCFLRQHDVRYFNFITNHFLLKVDDE